MKHLSEEQLIKYQFRLLEGSEAADVADHLAGCATCRELLGTLQRKFAPLELLREAPGASEALVARTLAELGRAGSVRRPWYRQRYWLGAAACLLAALAGWAAYEQFGKPASLPPVEQQVASRSHVADGGSPDGIDAPRSVGEEQHGAAADQPAGTDELLVAQAEGAQQEPMMMPPTEHKMTPGVTHRAAVESERLAEQDAGRKPTTWQGDPPALLGSSEPDKMVATPNHGQDAHATKKRITGRMPMPHEERGQDALATERPPFAPASNIELVTLPRREGVQLTVYNGANLTLVRERRKLTLKRGWNWLQFAWANTLIDPTSLYLEPQAQRDKIHVEQLVYPPRLQQIGRWLIKSETAGAVPFEITYFTSGVAWRAFYMGTLSADESTMRLQGYVRLDNHSGEDYADAQTRLVVGKVHLLDQIAELAKRRYAYGGPVEREDKEFGVPQRTTVLFAGNGVAWGMGEGTMHGNSNRHFGDSVSWGYFGRPKEIVKEGLSEYFLYTIEGTETIANGWAKRLGSLKADEVEVVNLYKYEEEMYGQAVVRFLSFSNDEEHKLGETPIPGGMLKVYRSVDEAGYLSYEGQSEFKYIPVNEEVELNLGPAENVIVKPTLMKTATDNYRFDDAGNVIGYDDVTTFKVEVKNTRDLPVKAEIKRNFGTTKWELTRQGAYGDYEEVDADTVRFTLTLGPRSKASFEYTVKTEVDPEHLTSVSPLKVRPGTIPPPPITPQQWVPGMLPPELMPQPSGRGQWRQNKGRRK